ncbi:MAG: hypothetical protein OXI01_12655 [Albidovulum sp.]|nr:hypothetical protein [Albidovulum sp.]
MTGNLNGSVNLLADAMRKVFTEAVEVAVEPLTTQVSALRTNVADMRTEIHSMEERLNKRIDTTNENMQAQFAEQEKKIGTLISERRPPIT